MLDRFLKRTSDISLSSAEHGADGNDDLVFEPSYIIRGLTKLHVALKPRSAMRTDRCRLGAQDDDDQQR